ncbi:MAG: terpene synthase [Streptomycetaceae bacterium]|nr:terpene synthase [Streptomycetaceae bacterium]
MTQRLAVPPIYSPFEPAIHPRYAAIDKQTSEWADKFAIGSEELRTRLVTHEIGVLAARVLPDAQPEIVGILSDFLLWLFGVDDGCCEEGVTGTDPHDLVPVLSRLIRVAQNPETPMLPDDSLAQGVRDLRGRLALYATPAQTGRWIDGLREYFLALVWEAAHRSRGTIPTLGDYTMMRMGSGADSTAAPMLECAYGYELQQNDRDATAVRALGEMAYFVIAWDNDIFSFHKENRSDKYVINIVQVLEHEYCLTSAEALALAIAQRDRVLCLFVRVREQLLRTAAPELSRYLASLGTYIRAAQDWSLSSRRYTTPDDPADLPIDFTDTPTDDSSDPLPIPPISWWWGLLPR